MRRLDLSLAAEKQLKKLPEASRARVVERLRALRGEPYPADSRQLAGALYRCAEAGDWRVLYAVGAERVTIAHLLRRRSAELYELVARRGR